MASPKVQLFKRAPTYASIGRPDRDDLEIRFPRYNPTGSTMYANFNTSKTNRWETHALRCHINWVILDSDWEAEFCRVAESHPRVKAYAKNHNLGLEVPYRYGSETRRYLPDFIVMGHMVLPDMPGRAFSTVEGMGHLWDI